MLERADEQCVALLARVEGALGVAQHGQLGVARADLLHRLGDDVVVLERHDRQVDARQPRDLPRPLAGRVHHDVGADLALGGLDHPAVGLVPHAGDGRAAHDPRAAAGGPLGERVRDARGVHVTVRRQIRTRQHAVERDQREQLVRPLGSDDLERYADLLRDPADVVELVDPVLVLGQPDGATAMEADGLAGLLLERLVEVEAALQQPHDVRVADELGAESRGVPGRPRS